MIWEDQNPVAKEAVIILKLESFNVTLMIWFKHGSLKDLTENIEVISKRFLISKKKKMKSI